MATAPAILVTIGLFVLVVQVSLWFYARMVVTGATQHGLDAARVYHDSPEDATSAGRTMVSQFIGQVGGADIPNAPEDITVTVTDDEVTVRVHAETVNIFPEIPFPGITVELAASREQLAE